MADRDRYVDEIGRAHPPLAADEAGTLLGFLDYQRATFEWKCSGLAADGMRVTVGPSSMTIAGLLKHLAYVEDDWSSRWLHGRPRPDPWESVDWSADQDWEWSSALTEEPQDLMAFWRRSVTRSQALIDDALNDGGLEKMAARSWPDGRTPSLRWILVHLIEEYARHNGHADLLRESVDGEVGE